ncbi:MAG: hypothetical protein QOD99_2585 [Chthoniobacter sp.]|nr:hypothetical protein [Chthoniobacter sp.]
MGVGSRCSSDLVHWKMGPQVFPEPPAWITTVAADNKGYFWAPDVIHLGDRYLLYYSVSTFGKKTSAIALAVNSTLDPGDPTYHWEDYGIIVQTTERDDFNAIDPCVTTDASGKLWLALGSYWSGIKLIELDPATGLRLLPAANVYSLAKHGSIEAAYIYSHTGFYYLFVNWGQCCRGIESTYNIRVGRSKEITGPYLDRAGIDMRRDGGSTFLESDGPFIGPGHAGIFSEGGKDWLSYHYYDARNRGRGTLNVVPLEWGADGWPKALTKTER